MSTLWWIVCSSSSSGCLSAGFASDAHFSCVTESSCFSILRGRMSSCSRIHEKTAPNDRISNWISGNIQFSVESVATRVSQELNKLNVTEHDFSNDKILFRQMQKLWIRKEVVVFWKNSRPWRASPFLVQIKQRRKGSEPAFFKAYFYSEEEKFKVKIPNFRQKITLFFK